MQPRCHHMLGMPAGMHESTALMNGFGPFMNGFGLFATLAMVLLASLALGLLMWGAQLRRLERDGAVPLFVREQPGRGEYLPEALYQERSSRTLSSSHYEQPQAQYSDMPYEQYQAERPQAQYPDTPV